MGKSVGEWMGGFISRWVSLLVGEWVGGLISGQVCVLVSGWVDLSVDG